jgi:hypothetical protein
MPQHFQRGYAVAEVSYTFQVTRTSHTRQAEPRHPHDMKIPTPATVTQQKSEEWKGQYWAKCKKNQTHDRALSEWVTRMVRPTAEALVRHEIKKRNTGNARRVGEWAREHPAPTKDIPPEIVHHAPFDGSRLKVGAPHAQEEEPECNWYFGGEIDWE